MAAVRHIGFAIRVLGPPTNSTWDGLHRSAKFGWNDSKIYDFKFMCLTKISTVRRRKRKYDVRTVASCYRCPGDV